MFENSYDKDEGVSVWGHMLNGAETGGMAGALFGGVGAIPGAILGGLGGLATGLWDSHQDGVAEDAWKNDMNGLKPGSAQARALEKSVDQNADSLLAKNKGPVDAGALADHAIDQTYHQQESAKLARDGGGSLWDHLF